MLKRNTIYQTICVELGKANLVSPNRADVDDLREMAEIFYEILKEWSGDTIELAFRDHMKSNKWMPSPADIEARCRSVSQSLEYNRDRSKALPIPEELSEKQRKKNLEQLQKIMSPEVQTIYINEKYKPKNPMSEKDLNIIYVKNAEDKKKHKSSRNKR